MIVNIDSKNLNLKGNEPKNLVFKKKVILLNKPRKFIKTFLDDHNWENLIDLIHEQYKNGFFPIGRLSFLSKVKLSISINGEIFRNNVIQNLSIKNPSCKINGELNKIEFNNKVSVIKY